MCIWALHTGRFRSKIKKLLLTGNLDHVIGVRATRHLLQDSRRRTLGELEDLRDEWLDLEPPMGHNTLRSILYRMVSTEVEWLYTVLQQEMPADMKAHFPHDDRDETGNLARLEGKGPDACLEKMARAREVLIAGYKAMSAGEFRKLRAITHWTDETHYITPERVLYHLVNHDAEHRGELVMIIQHFKEHSEEQ
jgi:uncharacterized damage-inducible protein DinB